MNEELIQKFMKLKVAEAELLMEILPPSATRMVKLFGRLVYEEVGKCLYNQEKDGTKDSSSGNIHQVNID